MDYKYVAIDVKLTIESLKDIPQEYQDRLNLLKLNLCERRKSLEKSQ